MIQRIQSIWLFFAGVFSLGTLKFSFYSGNKDNKLFTELNGSSYFLLLILAVVVALTALSAIFLFRNRKLQMQLGLVGFLLQVIAVVVYFLQTKQYTEGSFTLTSVLTFAIPVFFILAIMGIRKDDKLVKSMDRLR